MSTEPVLTQHKVTVLLIDDQPMIGEAVRRMLAGEMVAQEASGLSKREWRELMEVLGLPAA